MRKVLVAGVVALGMSLISVAAPAPVFGARAGQAAGTVAPGDLKLFTADWSRGLSGWSGDASWKPLRGELLSDGTAGESTVLAPYDTRAVTDYAVEARIRAVKGDDFGIVLRHSASDKGYVAVVDGDTAWIGAGDEPHYAEKIADGQRFSPGSDWHTYRIEADGNQLRFLIDGAQFAAVLDNRYLSGGNSGLAASYTQIEVNGFSVLRLR